MSLPLRTQYLGSLVADPAVGELVSGNWWYNSSDREFKFFNGEIISLFGGTYSKTVYVPGEAFGRPNTNPPNVVDQDNLTLYSFTLNTDDMTFKLKIPSDYYSGGFTLYLVWTNDGGTDDNGKNVKWQLNYQVGGEGDVIAGSHVNSPKTAEDTYTSALGWVEHHTPTANIAEADFTGKLCVFLRIRAITPSGTALTSEPHLIGLCLTYTARRYPT